MTQYNPQYSPLYNLQLAYKDKIKSPLAQSLILAALTWPTVRYGVPIARNVIVEGVRNMTGTTGANIVGRQLQTPLVKHILPWVAALGVGGLTLAPYIDSKYKNYGVMDWVPQYADQSIQKHASFDMPQYTPTIDMGMRFDPRQAQNIFQNNPAVNSGYPYALGTSIVNGMHMNTGRQPTIGNLFDSAQQKFSTKLTLGGISKGALKATLASSMAGMFTDIVGTVVGFPPDVQKTLTRSAAIGSALHSILT